MEAVLWPHPTRAGLSHETALDLHDLCGINPKPPRAHPLPSRLRPPAEKLVFQRPFDDSEKAVSAYENMEAAHRNDKHMEIAPISADSIETVMLTHGNYFDAVPSASPYLAGI
jgi:hypothetical protein